MAACLCGLGEARGLNADTVCRQLLEPGAAGWLVVRQAFGGRFFLADQRLDRPLLRKTLFEDHEFRQKLNTLLHPLVRSEIAARLEEETAQARLPMRFVVEVPLLYESCWEDDFSRVVVVYSDQETCQRRIMLRDRISEAEAQKAVAAQMPLLDKAILADHVIDNTGPWSDTCLQILHLRKLLW